MFTHLKRQGNLSIAYFVKTIYAILILLSVQTTAFAAIIIHGNQVINTPTTYNNVTLDLTDGRFTVVTGGTLTIQNSIVNMTVSPTNPFFIALNNGGINLANNTINVKVSGIAQNGDIAALYQLINITQGNVNVSNNTVSIDTPFTVSFLTTQSGATNGFNINSNSMTNFHGGLYLNNSSGALVNGNTFSNVSFSNIYFSGGLGKFTNNTFMFPGNLHMGNAYDIVNADGVTISNNIITSGSDYGISLTGVSNVFIENNKITDGRLFAIIINTASLHEVRKNKYLSKLVPMKKLKMTSNDNIVISNNYFGQNRYGIIAGIVDTLIITNNLFLQRFNDSSTRQYWTDNTNLLPAVNNLIWSSNTYKEAFTQDNEGDNTPSLQFVTFPAQGGVFIN